MNGLLTLLLAVVLTQPFWTKLPELDAAFDALPPECAAEYDPFLRQERNASGTRICRCDLDGDGEQEMLVWTGDGGTGGEDWSVMTRRGGRFRRAGQVLGILHFIDRPPHRGLLVESPCGWEHDTWEFWELKNGRLVCRLTLNVRYATPEGNTLRTRPVEIKIRY